MNDINLEELVKYFHAMWDNFPGFARLIDNRHKIIASNFLAKEAGFNEEELCIKVGSTTSHIGCLSNKCIKEQKTQIQKVSEGKFKYWLPVKGYSNFFIHLTLDTSINK